jgi:hypothetical protein
MSDNHENEAIQDFPKLYCTLSELSEFECPSTKLSANRGVKYWQGAYIIAHLIIYNSMLIRVI